MMKTWLGRYHSIDGLGIKHWSFPTGYNRAVNVFDRGANCADHGIPAAERFLIMSMDNGRLLASRNAEDKAGAERAMKQLLEES